MVDEAHERSLSSDVLLGVLKKITKKRPELRIVISSATVKAEDFRDFFAGARLFKVELQMVKNQQRTRRRSSVSKEELSRWTSTTSPMRAKTTLSEP